MEGKREGKERQFQLCHFFLSSIIVFLSFLRSGNMDILTFWRTNRNNLNVHTNHTKIAQLQEVVVKNDKKENYIKL